MREAAPFLISGGAAALAVGALPPAVIDTGLTLAVLAGTAALAWRSQTTRAGDAVGTGGRARALASPRRPVRPRTLPLRPSALVAIIERTHPC